MVLYCFGDSYTEGYKNDMGFWPYDAYRKYLGLDDPKDMPPVWSELLGEKLGIESFNYGKGGASNNEIFLRVSENSHKFKKDDIVIINWTYIQRVLWVIEDELNGYKNLLTSVGTHQGEHYDRDGMFKPAYDIIAINRTNFSWTYEIQGYQNMINSLSDSIGFKVYYWFADDVLFNNMKKLENVYQEKYIIHDLIKEYIPYNEKYQFANIPFNILKQYGAKTITQDSDGNGHDGMHLGGTGHKVQSEIFYSYITKTPYPKKLEKYL